MILHLHFLAPPPANSLIQVRHIGFAGATAGGGGVTGFYGRSGNATLQSTDDIVVRNVNSSGVITATSFEGTFVGSSQIGIQSGGVQIGAGITQLNFIGIGNTIVVDGSTVDISIQSGAGGTWHGYSAGIATVKSVGVNTSTLDDTDLTGIGNSFKGLYIANGMVIHDNTLSGNHYIGTNFSGMMAGPVSVTGVLSIDGNYVVV